MDIPSATLYYQFWFGGRVKESIANWVTWHKYPSIWRSKIKTIKLMPIWSFTYFMQQVTAKQKVSTQIVTHIYEYELK